MSAGYEKSDVSIKKVFTIGGISIIILIGIIIAISQYFSAVKEEMINELTLKPVSAKLVKLREYETRQLSTYGVIDKEKGIYRIPVDEAIKKVVARQ